jgi:cbb3-type cytochrome oxidase maturation protein
MESLYLLIPLSIVLVLAIAGVLVWSVLSGQFDDLDFEGRRILDDEDDALPRPDRVVKYQSHTRPGNSQN